jgi:hypothetical protein
MSPLYASPSFRAHHPDFHLELVVIPEDSTVQLPLVEKKINLNIEDMIKANFKEFCATWPQHKDKLNVKPLNTKRAHGLSVKIPQGSPSHEQYEHGTLKSNRTKEIKIIGRFAVMDSTDE